MKGQCTLQQWGKKSLYLSSVYQIVRDVTIITLWNSGRSLTEATLGGGRNPKCPKLNGEKKKKRAQQNVFQPKCIF